MSDMYAQQLEMQLRFSEEEKENAVQEAYEEGVNDGIDKCINVIKQDWKRNYQIYDAVNALKKLKEQQ